MKSFRGYYFTLLTLFLLYAYSTQAQTVSTTMDTLNLNGIPLAELVDYIKGHYSSMADYLKTKGYEKNSDSETNVYYNAAAQSRVYFSPSTGNHTLPNSIAGLKQNFVAMKSDNKNFLNAIEKIIYDLKTDENFAVDIAYINDEYNFYSIKKDFHIKIILSHPDSVLAVY